MKRLLLLIGLLVVLGVLSACARPTPEVVTVKETVVVEKPVEKVVEKTVVVTPTPPPTGPKTLIVCMAQEPENLYWWGSSMLVARAVEHAIYDGPIDNRTYDYQPVILEKLPSLDDGDAIIQKVTVNKGDKYVDETGAVTTCEQEGGCGEMEQMVVTFKLKPGIKWEDGEPVTAYDSEFSFNIASDPESGVASRYVFDRTASYVAVDELTTVWTGLPGYKDATYFTNFFQPLPKHQLEGTSAAELIEDDRVNRSPLSYGAFKMKEWIPGTSITLVRNEYYWRANEGLPKVDEVIFKFIPDTNQLLAQLLAGECDIGTQDGMDVTQAPFLLQAEEAGILKPYFVTGTVWEHIDFNIDPVDDRYVFFDDVRVRKAIAYCTDRQSMVDQILFGKSKVIHTFLPEEHWGYPPEDMLVKYEYNPEKGRALLAEAGWTDTDGDGIVDKDGVKFSVEWGTTSGNKMREQIGQIFQQNMKDCGIEVNLKFRPASVWFADGPDGPLFGRRFDLGEFAWLTGVEPPVELYMCEQIPSEENAWSGQNETGYCNPEYDKYANQVLQTINRADRLPPLYEVQRIFSDELPVLPLFLRLKVAATRPEVVGFNIDPTENSEMWNIEELDLVTQ